MSRTHAVGRGAQSWEMCLQCTQLCLQIMHCMYVAVTRPTPTPISHYEPPLQGKRRQFGVYLLHKAYLSYLVDPPQPVRHTDL